MALLHSLQISGVRNFSPETKERVVFNTPVTLFLGKNGSGKTSIIECIKYALTGAPPGGTNSGKGFLNDPKMSGKDSTRASIKMEFFDAQGNLITVSRLMSVTTGADGKLGFKRLKSQVHKRDKYNLEGLQDLSGEDSVNVYCCTALNVSQSVLNNVLFCHQENSLWPLDESAKLKKTFDEIFEAAKYNKLVDLVRKYLKCEQNKLQFLRESLSLKKTLTKKVEQLGEKLNKKNDELGQTTKQIDETWREIEPLKSRRNEIIELENTIGILQKELIRKRTEKKGLQEQQARIKKHIPRIYEGNAEDLKKKIDRLVHEKAENEKYIEDAECKKKTLTTKIDKINCSIQELHGQIAAMREEQKHFENNNEKRKQLVKTLSLGLGLRETEDVDNKEIIIHQFRVAIKEKRDNYDSLVEEKNVEEIELQNRIERILEQYIATNEHINSKNKAIVESENKMTEIQKKLDELNTKDSQLNIVENKIKNLQNTLHDYKDAFDEAEKQKQIEDLRQELNKKERSLTDLEKEYRILQQNLLTEQKLENEKNIIVRKQNEISQIESKQIRNIQKLFGDHMPERDVKRKVLEIENQQSQKLKKLTDKITELEKDATTLEAALNHERKKLNGEKEDLASKKKKVADLCKDRALDDVLNETLINRNKLQNDKGQYISAKIMFNAFIEKFEKPKPCCPICETDFSYKSTEVKAIINNLKSKINSVPTKLDKVKNELRKEENFYTQLQQLKPVDDEIESLQNIKIPLTEKEITRLTKEKKEKQTELALEKLNQTTPEEFLEACRNFITDAALLDQHSTDVTRAKNAVADLEWTIVTVSSNRSRHDTEAEIEGVKAKLNDIKSRYELCKENLNVHREKCQEFYAHIQTETQEQIDLQKQVQQKSFLETQLAEYREKLVSLKDEIEELTMVLTAQKAEKQNAEKEKETALLIYRNIEKDERKRMIANENILDEIQNLHDAIENYTKNNKARKLAETVRKLDELKGYEGELNDAKDDVTRKKETVAKLEVKLRALNDSITLEENRRQEDELDEEIGDIEKTIGTYKHRINDEKDRIEKQLEDRNHEISRLIGQREELGKQVRDLEEELEMPENKEAFNNHKKQYYELRVKELAIQDYIKYVNVLEKSVLKFHEEKMVQINRTIKELWRGIYTGNDVDYIEIKTDDDMTGDVNNRRSYNYKVVQVKNGVELEMRGRCSAGQKVIACLIIRMALAETFSSNCGILALDEPTTNLDEDNMTSLCGALARIVDAREREKNFQLLIITHDETFLNALSTGTGMESCWKVVRNPEGFSTVKKHDL